MKAVPTKVTFLGRELVMDELSEDCYERDELLLRRCDGEWEATVYIDGTEDWLCAFSASRGCAVRRLEERMRAMHRGLGLMLQEDEQ